MQPAHQDVLFASPAPAPAAALELEHIYTDAPRPVRAASRRPKAHSDFRRLSLSLGPKASRYNNDLRASLLRLHAEAKHRGNLGNFTYAQGLRLVGGGFGRTTAQRMVRRLVKARVVETRGLRTSDARLVLPNYLSGPGVKAAALSRKSQVKADAAAAKRRRRGRANVQLRPLAVSETPQKQAVSGMSRVVYRASGNFLPNISTAPPSRQALERAAEAVAQAVVFQPLAAAFTKVREDVGDKNRRANQGEDNPDDGDTIDWLAWTKRLQDKAPNAAPQTPAAPPPTPAPRPAKAVPQPTEQPSAPSYRPVTVLGDHLPADAAWLRQHMARLPGCAGLNIKGTAARSVPRWVFRAAMGSVLVRHPGQVEDLVGMVLAATKKILAGEFKDRRYQAWCAPKSGWPAEYVAFAGLAPPS